MQPPRDAPALQYSSGRVRPALLINCFLYWIGEPSLFPTKLLPPPPPPPPTPTHLSTPGHLPSERSLHDLVRALHDVGGDVLSPGGGTEDGAQVSDAGERHVEGAGNWRRRQGQDVHARRQHLFFVYPRTG